MRMGDRPKPCQPVFAFMNVPTEEYLDVVKYKEENADDLLWKRSASDLHERTFLENRVNAYLMPISKMYPVSVLGKHDDRPQEDSSSNNRTSDVKVDFPMVREPFHLVH